MQYLNDIIQKHSIDYDCTEFELIPIEKQFTATIPGLWCRVRYKTRWFDKNFIDSLIRLNAMNATASVRCYFRSRLEI